MAASGTYRQVTDGKARVFIRVVDQAGRVVDMLATCDAVEIDTNFSISKVGRSYVAEHPIGDVKFDNFQALAFIISEPGHSLDRFLHDGSLPTREEIYPIMAPPWYKVLAEGMGPGAWPFA